jgi:hypothetical protein
VKAVIALAVIVGCSSTPAPVDTVRAPAPPFHKRAVRNEQLARDLRANGANVLASLAGESFGIFDERNGQLSHVCGPAARETATSLGASFADPSLPAPACMSGTDDGVYCIQTGGVMVSLTADRTTLTSARIFRASNMPFHPQWCDHLQTM